MYQEKLALKYALHLQDTGEFIIVDASPEHLPPVVIKSNPDLGFKWKTNFNYLQSKIKNILPDKILEFFNSQYVVEIEEEGYSETNTISWRYVHVVPSKKVNSRGKSDDLEYVYILTNEAMPDLVKIGMTKLDVYTRVKTINTSGIVSEWVPKFAVVLQKGSSSKIESAMHRYFASERVSSDKGTSREFFKIKPLEALDKLREISEGFSVGDPIVF